LVAAEPDQSYGPEGLPDSLTKDWWGGCGMFINDGAREL
jgi:hypothetical protein